MLQLVAKALFVLAGLAFFVGGRAIHEFAGVERVLAEVEGLALTFAFGLVAFIAQRAGEDLADEEAEPDKQ